MKNRAKCKLCHSIIESFHPTDYVICNCGEISVYGGDSMICSAKNWDNFLRVDDEGNEIFITVKSPQEEVKDRKKITRAEMKDIVNEIKRKIELLPTHAMDLPLNHYDYLSILMLFSSILEVD